jgi:hypothetical protein
MGEVSLKEYLQVAKLKIATSNKAIGNIKKVFFTCF